MAARNLKPKHYDGAFHVVAVGILRQKLYLGNMAHSIRRGGGGVVLRPKLYLGYMAHSIRGGGGGGHPETKTLPKEYGEFRVAAAGS